MKKILSFPLICLFAFITIFYSPTILQNKLPIPADTIVALYHPWRDFFAKNYPSGIPFKNFQITDSVRQQYPWRNLSLDLIKRGEIPLWNPYSFSGTPLLGNFQSAVIYPLNFLYLLIEDFASVWSIQVILQTVLGGIFMYVYLHNFKLKRPALILGTLAWIGSGFFVAWQQWNTVVHVAIYLPLILLSVDELILEKHSRKKTLFWMVVFIASLLSSFFAGYLQPFFYIFVTGGVYLLARIYQTKRYKQLLIFAILYFVFFVLALPQLLPTLQFIALSARDIDQANWSRPDWFLPWQNLVQLIAPDFFGNPATLNYFGIWNYQEFVSYVGIVPLIFALTVLIVRRDKKTLFWGALLILALIMALPTPLSKLPFILHLPFISSAQPSRIIMLVDFSLAVLAALGLDYFLKKTQPGKVFLSLSLAIFLGLMSLAAFAIETSRVTSQRNLIMPVFVTVTVILLFLLAHLVTKTKQLIVLLIIALTAFDLLRFATKFEPFSSRNYLYPSTKIMSFLQDKSRTEVFRVAALDDRILPPNFNIMYKVQTPSGYDPLYLKRYGEFIAALERGKPDTSPPWGFNRIVTPKNINNRLYGLLNTRYLLSFSQFPDYKLLAKEGITYLYQYPYALPRAFFVTSTVYASNDQEAINKMNSQTFSPAESAVVLDFPNSQFSSGEARIVSYQENSLDIQTENVAAGFLVLLDAYYPSWKATIDNIPTSIYITNYTFRGVKVPAGKHTVRFYLS